MLLALPSVCPAPLRQNCCCRACLRPLTALRSPYSSTPGRTAKPFNPLLGETYELVCPEKGFRFLAEKVGTDQHECGPS